MSTDLCFGTVPVIYEEIFETCSFTGNAISEDVYNILFKQCNLKNAQIDTIITILGLKKHRQMTRSILYKSLALIAWAQQGKELTDKLFDNFAGVELPIPSISNLSTIKNVVREKHVRLNHQGIIYADIQKIDDISIELVPEKKGLFLKHSEYIVISQRFRASVRRRYNDFLALHEIILSKYPYRLIPRLPPKKVVVASAEARFLEDRRRSLSRWLNLIARHPTLSYDPVVEYFLTQKEHEDLRFKIRELFGKSPDEFTISGQSEFINESITPEMALQFTKSQDHISVIYHGLKKIKQIFDRVEERHEAHATDMNEVGKILLSLGAIASAPHITNSSWENTKLGLISVAGEFNHLSAIMQKIASPCMVRSASDAREGLLAALDSISGARDLFRRLNRGVHAERTAVAIGGSSLIVRTSHKAQEEVLKARGVFAMHCVEEEAALALAGLVQVGAAVTWLAQSQAVLHKQMATLWDEISTTLLSRNFSVTQHSNGSTATL